MIDAKKPKYYELNAYWVKTTNNYSKFKLIEENRDVKQLDNKASVKESIKKYGYYHLPILVNEKYEIIEGQHRFEACKELGLPIHYIMQNGLTAKDCAPINSYRKNWVISDYVHLYAAENIGYRYFEILTQRFGYKPSVVYVAMGKNLTGGGSNTTIKNGYVECEEKDYLEAQEVLSYISQFKTDIETNNVSGRINDLYCAIIFAWRSKQVDRNLLAQRLHKNFHMFGVGVVNVNDAIEKIEKIYNFRCKSENQIDLVHEYKIASRESKAKAIKKINKG